MSFDNENVIFENVLNAKVLSVFDHNNMKNSVNPNIVNQNMNIEWYFHVLIFKIML